MKNLGKKLTAAVLPLVIIGSTFFATPAKALEGLIWSKGIDGSKQLNYNEVQWVTTNMIDVSKTYCAYKVCWSPEILQDMKRLGYAWKPNINLISEVIYRYNNGCVFQPSKMHPYGNSGSEVYIRLTCGFGFKRYFIDTTLHEGYLDI